MRILSAKEVAEKTSFSTGHLRRLAKENKFPKPVQIRRTGVVGLKRM